MQGPAGKSRCVSIIRAAFVSSLLVTAFLAGPPASAGSFRVNPVHVTMAPDRQTASLTIRNTDLAEVSVRVTAYRWTQEDGRDVYAETTDLIASPPIFTIAPGASQLVRVGLRERRPGGAYRLIIEEIPRKQSSGSNVQVTLRLNLPLYLLPPKGGVANLKWRIWREWTGDMFAEAANSGSLHAQILGIGATTAAGDNIILSKEMGVILPSSTRSWKLGRPSGLAVGASLLLNIRAAAGEIREKVQVERR
jgi:fimbrial chaperone protein